MKEFKNYAHEQATMNLANHITRYCQEKGVSLEVLNDALEIVEKSFYTDAVIKGNKETCFNHNVVINSIDMNKFSERLKKEVEKNLSEALKV